MSAIAVRAYRPMNSSRTTCSTEAVCAHTGAKAASTVAADGSATGRMRSRARDTSAATEGGPATSTSCPASAHAWAKGASGPK